MIQLCDDCSFARETRSTRGTDSQSVVRDLQNDCLTGMTVNGLEDCGHPASFDECCDLEAPVDQFADFDFVAQTLSNGTWSAAKKSLRFC
jgi:hypothetical protein